MVLPPEEGGKSVVTLRPQVGGQTVITVRPEGGVPPVITVRPGGAGEPVATLWSEMSRETGEIIIFESGQNEEVNGDTRSNNISWGTIGLWDIMLAQ